MVRIFKLASGAADEYAFMFADEYTAVVQRQRMALAAKQMPAAHLAAFDWFLHSVVPACPEVGFSESYRLAAGACTLSFPPTLGCEVQKNVWCWISDSSVQ